MKKRLLQAQDIAQLMQAVPLDFNEKNDWKERGYSNYTNVAWVTPIEAQTIMKAFGPAYISEGAEKDSFYVTPKYLEPEVEAVIWRLRGTTPIEYNDKATYASTRLAGKCPTCKGRGSSFNKETNKREKCSDCRGTGEMTGKKREQLTKEKKTATIQVKTTRLIKEI